ncbi:Uncharacterised protein [Vibrio cholerae]|nr:Uncharacterised protein [Vibrio cholerae]
MALSTASTNSAPCAKYEAIADESEQPVPCVFFVAIRGAQK